MHDGVAGRGRASRAGGVHSQEALIDGSCMSFLT
jgi:hypothetical protein